MGDEWDEYVAKAQKAFEKVLSVGDTYVDQFVKLAIRHSEAKKRINKLLYWLDIDDEVWDMLTPMEKSDHLHMQKELKAIKDILLGKGKSDD